MLSKQLTSKFAVLTLKYTDSNFWVVMQRHGEDKIVAVEAEIWRKIAQQVFQLRNIFKMTNKNFKR